MNPAINNSSGHALEYSLDIDFFTLLKLLRATGSKHHKLGGLTQNKTKLFSHSMEIKRFEIKVLAWFGPSETRRESFFTSP